MAIVIFKENDTKQQIYDGIFSLFNFDEDHNGNNGEEYTLDIAIDKGYTSNLDYWISGSLLEVNDPYSVIELILKEICDIFEKDSYYEYISFETLEEDKITVATVQYKSRD